jgi:23S rRNA-/tRNA-specific pseudouridylate synthase
LAAGLLLISRRASAKEECLKNFFKEKYNRKYLVVGSNNRNRAFS